MMRRKQLATIFCAGLLAFMAGGLSAAEEPALHEKIDQQIEAAFNFEPAPAADDAEFLRRVYLDLTGTIPSLAETQAFLQDQTANKRASVIDRLLDSPQYVRHMQQVFDVALMLRRPDKFVKAPEWQAYLRQSFAENKPYNQLAAEILAPDLSQGTPPSAKFYMERDCEPNLLTRDVGRLFMGRDMQCAQCHDHPLIDGYKQDHYFGIFAFLNRTYLFTDKAKKTTLLAEKGEGGVTFVSVFDPKKETHQTGPKIITGAPIVEPEFKKGEEYIGKPGKDEAGTPKFSRREQLALLATSGDCESFNLNISNRLWAMMMGRGLVHPVDMHHPENPPSHPELLKLLTDEFVAMGFDIKAFLRQLALTRTYQRSSLPPENMTAEQAEPARFAVAILKPLTPEQLAWSLLEASGTAEANRTAEVRRLEADKRLNDIFQVDARGQRLLADMVEQAGYPKLSPTLSQFIGLFGSAPGDPEGDFQATVHQALFMTNGPTLKGWTTAVASRAANHSELPDNIQELYLRVLSRPPAADEAAETLEYIIRHPDRKAALEEIAWALLTSTEFRFNH